MNSNRPNPIPLIATTLGYVFGFYFLYPQADRAIAALVLIPVIVAAMGYGKKGGIISGIISIGTTYVMYQLVGDGDYSQFKMGNLYALHIMTIISGWVIGWNHDLRLEVERQHTDLLESEVQLKASDQQLFTMWDLLPDAVIMNNGEMIQYINPAGLRMLEAQHIEEIVGFGLDRYIHPDDLAKIPGRHERIVQGKIDRMVFEELFVTRRGKIIPVEVHLRRAIYSDKEMYVVVARDITAQKQHAQKIQNVAEFEKTLNEITNISLQDISFQDMLQHVADKLGHLFKADGAFITIWNSETQLAQPAAAYGYLRETYPKQPPSVGVQTATASALALGRVLAIEDVHSTPYISPEISKKYPTKSILALPLIAGEEKLGAALVSYHAPRTFTQAEVDWGEQAAKQLALALIKTQLFETVHRQAIIDSLTGIYNRRHLFETGQKELNRALRYQNSLAALIFDIDHFKQINDQYGHLVGDQILIQLAEVSATILRESDTFGRYGGEEFVILMPETDLRGAEQMAERLRIKVMDGNFTVNDQITTITVSGGVFALAFDEDGRPNLETLEELLDGADRAMYQAKLNGRNRVEVFKAETV